MIEIKHTINGEIETYYVTLPEPPACEFCVSYAIAVEDLDLLNSFFVPLIGGKFLVEVFVFGFDAGEALFYERQDGSKTNSLLSHFKVVVKNGTLEGVSNMRGMTNDRTS